MSKFKDLVDLGFKVFAVQARAKEPAVSSWKLYQERFPNALEMERWETLGYNVGIPTGPCNGIVALDVDSEEAQALVDSLDLPPTPTFRTGRGRQLLFAYPMDWEIRNSVKVNGVELDVRGDNGYSVGPGSIHSSGAEYTWEISPKDVAFAEIPKALKDLLTVNKKGMTALAIIPEQCGEGELIPKKSMVLPGISLYLSDLLDQACKTISGEQEGARNDTLNRETFIVAQHVTAAKCEWAPFSARLVAAGVSAGLTLPECESTVQSAYEAGVQKPVGWLQTAQEWVHFAANDVLYHPKSRSTQPIRGFDRAFSFERPAGVKSLSGFLFNRGLILSVQDTRYAPGRERGVFWEAGLPWWNSYEQPQIAVENGDWGPLEDFLRYLIPNDDERSHLVRAIAWTIFRPAEKLRHAIMLRGVHQGSGKSILSKIWRAQLGFGNTKLATTEELDSPYQSFVVDTSLVVVEELNYAFGAKNYVKLKNVITDDTANVRELYKAARQVPNFANFLFITNLADSMQIENSDRRLFYLDTPAEPRNPEYYRDFVDWCEQNKGIIRGYFANVDLSDFNPHAPPPDTEAKAGLRHSSVPPLEQELLMALEDWKFPFNRDIGTFDDVRASLGSVARGKSVKAIQRAMGNVGCVPLSQIRVSGTWDRGANAFWHHDSPARISAWAFRNVDYWQSASPKEWAEEYARHVGRFNELDESILPGSGQGQLEEKA